MSSRGNVPRGLLAGLVAVWLCAGCGDAGKSEGGLNSASGEPDAGSMKVRANACDPQRMPKVPNTGLEYPDAHCDEDGCEVGGCDPLGRCTPACNAWSFDASLSFQAARVKDAGRVGAPPAPSGKLADDVCPGNMITPKGAAMNCCQRTDNSKIETPALRMTSLVYTRPTYFGSSPVVNATKEAFDGDLYNVVSVLSAREDGMLTATTGSAVPNQDGSFTPMHGAFQAGDVTLNKGGSWNALLDVPSELSTKDGVRTWKFGPTPADEDYVVIMWIDNTYDFARMELHMRAVEWSVPIDDSLTCVGERTSSDFTRVGKASGFVPLDDAIKTEIWVTRESSMNLCTSMSGAADCRLPVAKWRP